MFRLGLLLALSAGAVAQKSYEAVCRDLVKAGNGAAAAVCERCRELYPETKRCKAPAQEGSNLLVALCQTSFVNGDIEKARDYCRQCQTLDPASKACAAVAKKLGTIPEPSPELKKLQGGL
jgi:hypothetical protein